MVAAQQVYSMLGNESLWEVAVHCHQMLDQAHIAHSICGGVAVCLHGYQRNTTDVDLIVNAADTAQVKDVLIAAGYEWNETQREIRSPAGIALQFLIAGTQAGKGAEVAIPEPIGMENVEELEGLSVVRLSRLIEMKIACGSCSLRRTHKDFADVVELISIRKLDSSFARHLHKSIRKKFKELVRSANSEE